MPCDAKAQLFAKYSTLTEELFRATTALADVAGLHSTDYATLKLEAAQARMNAGLARIAFKRHVSEHGC